MKTRFLLYAVLLVIAVSQATAAVTVGSQFSVKGEEPCIGRSDNYLISYDMRWSRPTVSEDEGFWVKVMNPDGIEDFQFGDEARIRYSGTITAIGVDQDRILCKYTTLAESSGSSCPNGALFWLTKQEFGRRLALYEKRVKQEKEAEAERQRQEKLLAADREKVIKIVGKEYKPKPQIPKAPLLCPHCTQLLKSRGILPLVDELLCKTSKRSEARPGPSSTITTVTSREVVLPVTPAPTEAPAYHVEPAK